MDEVGITGLFLRLICTLQELVHKILQEILRTILIPTLVGLLTYFKMECIPVTVGVIVCLVFQWFLRALKRLWTTYKDKFGLDFPDLSSCDKLTSGDTSEADPFLIEKSIVGSPQTAPGAARVVTGGLTAIRKTNPSQEDGAQGRTSSRALERLPSGMRSQDSGTESSFTSTST